jgi:predicted membrane channel-forming protein YqfA (hemolysin III family)
MIFVHWLVVLSVLVSLAGAFTYIKDTLKGKTKPNRVSWFVWAAAPLVATAAALSAQADFWATIRIFMSGFVPLLIFIISFVNPKSYWKLTKFDFICGGCSIVAIGLWMITKQPILAILLLAVGDCFASIPTITKAWKNPETESGLTFVAGFLATLLILPSIKVWNIENSAFQIYLMTVNSIILFSIYRKRIFVQKSLQSV